MLKIVRRVGRPAPLRMPMRRIPMVTRTWILLPAKRTEPNPFVQNKLNPTQSSSPALRSAISHADRHDNEELAKVRTICASRTNPTLAGKVLPCLRWQVVSAGDDRQSKVAVFAN
jgi:hypothetical protein